MKTENDLMGEIFMAMSTAQGELLATLIKEFENRAHMNLATLQLADLASLDDADLQALGKSIYLAVGVIQLGLAPDKFGAAEIAGELPAVCYSHLYKGAQALARIKAAQLTRLDTSGYN